MRRFMLSMLAASVGAVGFGASPAGALPAAKSSTTVQLDSTFGVAGVAARPLSTDGDRFVAVVAAPGGKWYASGYVTLTGGDQAMAVSRLNADGSLDTTFGTGGTATANVAVGGKAVELGRTVAVQSTGKVLLAGPIEKDPTATGDLARDADIAVVRFLSDGKLDTTFGTAGIKRVDFGTGLTTGSTIVTPDLVWNLAVLANDKFVAIGGTKNPAAGKTDSDFAVAGFTKDGELDAKFGTNGVTIVDLDGAVDSPRGIQVQRDGKLVGAGYSRDGSGVVSPTLFRLTKAGQLDTTFGTKGIGGGKVLGSVTEAYDVGFQGSKFITAGYGTDVSGGKVDLVAVRWLKNGKMDTTFGTNGMTRIDIAGDDDRARDLVVLKSGHILIAGSGKPSATEIEAMLVLLDPDGAPTSTFGTNGRILTSLGGPNDSFFGVALNKQGTKAVAAGYKGAATAAGDDAALVSVSIAQGR